MKWISIKYALVVNVCAFVLLVLYTFYSRNNEKLVLLCSYLTEPKGTALPHLYVITPTYRRPEQVPEILRLSQTLSHVPDLTWLVVEDGTKTNQLIDEILKKSGIEYHYLLGPKPLQYQKHNYPNPSGSSNRNRALSWIRKNAKTGVFYFADDDNTYDLDLFKEIRLTKKVSMFPVGFVSNCILSSPIVRNGEFKGFYDCWIGNRKFAIDMAGFAVSVEFLLSRPKAIMSYTYGYQEEDFLKSLAPFEPEEAEFLADNCTKILAWHTQTRRNKPFLPLDTVKFNITDSNIFVLKKLIVNWL